MDVFFFFLETKSFLTLEKYKLGRDTFFSSCFVFNSLQVTINTLFLYEDGNGNVVEENGGPEPIEYIVYHIRVSF